MGRCCDHCWSKSVFRSLLLSADGLLEPKFVQRLFSSLSAAFTVHYLKLIILLWDPWTNSNHTWHQLIFVIDLKDFQICLYEGQHSVRPKVGGRG